MAYLDAEYKNARLIWSMIMDKVLIVGLIALAMLIASFVAVWLGYAPATM